MTTSGKPWGHEPQAAKNTDREIWRRKSTDPCDPDGFYQPSIHVTEGDGIGMDVDGRVVVMPIEKWHALAWQAHIANLPSEAACKGYPDCDAALPGEPHSEGCPAAAPEGSTGCGADAIVDKDEREYRNEMQDRGAQAAGSTRQAHESKDGENPPHMFHGSWGTSRYSSCSCGWVKVSEKRENCKADWQTHVAASTRQDSEGGE